MLSKTQILNLPSSPYSRWSKVPRVSCVYFVIDENSEILYIGKTENLRARLVGHRIRKHVARINGVRIYWFEYFKASDKLLPLERDYIINYKPRFNRTFINNLYNAKIERKERGAAQTDVIHYTIEVAP